MAYVAWQATVQDDSGNSVVNPVVTVYKKSDMSLAVLYSDDTGTVLANPINGGVDGFVQFWAEAGTYVIEGAKGAANARDWVADLTGFEYLTESVDAASGYADDAAGSALEAAGSADTALAAVDAVVSQGLWDYTPNDAAALAAITGMVSGETALVRNTMHVWEYNGSAWVDTGISPLSLKADKITLDSRITAGVAVIGGTQFGGDVWAVGGPDGKAGIALQADGTIRNKYLQEIDARLTEVEGPGVEPSGVASDRPLGAILDFLHFSIYGQSLSIGALGTPPRSTTAIGNWAKMFVGGIISSLASDPARYASLVDMREQTQETISSGMIAMIKQLLLDENEIDIGATGLTTFVTSSGAGGVSAAGLSPGSAHFTRLQTDMTQGKARSPDVAKSYQGMVMPYLQGEQDYTNGTAAETWKTQVRNIRSSAEAYSQGVSGLARPLPMILYQLSQHLAKGRDPTLAIAAVEMCQDDYIGFATPLYFIPAVDISHRGPDGYYWMGAYFGLAVKRWFWDNEKPMPMSPADVVWWNGGVSMQFPTQIGGLVFDTDAVVDPSNYGFEVYQSDGVTPVSITSVRIIAPDRVVINAAMPAGARVRYAWTGGTDDGSDREGPTNGARGNLRDSRGDTIIADPNGSAFPLHQWAPIFEEIRP